MVGDYKVMLGLMKFFFSIMIVCHHSGPIFDYQWCIMGGGYIGVEFFFIVSGYFLANSVNSLKNVGTDVTMPGEATRQFVLSKIKKIMPNYLIAILLSFVLYAVVRSYSIQTVLQNMVLVLSELFFLQMAGFPGSWVTGVAWYLSAMYIVMFIIYPIYRYKRDIFINIVAPLSIVLIYGLFAHNYGHLNQPDMWMGFIFKGVLRSFAGISLGCVVYEIGLSLKGQNFNFVVKGLLTLIEVVGYIGVFIYAYYMHLSVYDFFVVMLITVCVLISINGVSYTEKMNHMLWVMKISKFLEKLSLSVFLNHYYWSVLIPEMFSNMDYRGRCLVYFCAVLISAVINMLIADGIKKYIKQKRRENYD